MNAKKKICLLIGSIGMAIILIGATQENEEILNYYPLKVGNVRIYRSPLPAEQREEVSTYDNTLNAYMVSSVVKVNDSPPYLLQKIYEARNGKILLLATPNKNTGEPVWKKEPEVLLSSPLKVGTIWEQEFESGTKCIKKIVGLETVTVKAGTFNKVCIVEKINYETLPGRNKREMTIVSKSYYAPNVGLIKKETVGMIQMYQDNITGEVRAKPYRKYKIPQVVLELLEYNYR